VLALSAVSLNLQAAEAQIVDCPLRETPLSLDSPFFHILVSPEAKEVFNSSLPGFLDSLPDDYQRIEPPTAEIRSTYSLTRSVRMVIRSHEIPESQLEEINRSLAALNITDADRKARCVNYDVVLPDLNIPEAEHRILVFNKVVGFHHGPVVGAATDAIRAIGNELGWGVVVTNSAAVFTPEVLSQFDLVVWNNNYGDALTLSQREAFKNYITGGGGYLGTHAAGNHWFDIWPWYVEKLLGGARSIGHPGGEHQFQEAYVAIEPTSGGIGQQQMPGWTLLEEWYSFETSPRTNGVTVIANLDESTYEPLRWAMGEDHPIIWSNCIDEGRALYTAIGHLPEVYDDPEYRAVFRDAIVWTANPEGSVCK
jgi:type 1 glutamine amidotransferase